jgi:hypothetical protein
VHVHVFLSERKRTKKQHSETTSGEPRATSDQNCCSRVLGG